MENVKSIKYLREGFFCFSFDLGDDYYKNKCRCGRVKNDLYKTLEYFFNNKCNETSARILPKIDKVLDSLSNYQFSSMKINLEFKDMGFRFEIECTDGVDIIYYKNIYWALMEKNFILQQTVND